MKIKSIKLSLLFLALMIMVISCNPSKKYEKEEQQKIEEYLSGLGDTAYVVKPSGLVVIPLVEGTGNFPLAEDTVALRFKGSFLDGRVFTTNAGEAEPMVCLAGSGDLMDGYRLIDGLAEGTLYIKLGGKAKIITPSSLAYGTSGDIYGYIPGYTPLRWEIEIVDLRPGAKK